MTDALGLEGEYPEQELPLLIRRAGMVEWHDGAVSILDRRRLPEEETFLVCTTTVEVAEAIEAMVIQGAFSIAIAAGYGLALTKGEEPAAFYVAADRLRKTRPTGLALNRMMAVCVKVVEDAAASGLNITSELLNTVNDAAQCLARQGWRTGMRAADMLPEDGGVLTHCFPDRSYAYMLVALRRSGKNIRVFCSETRPYLQGARLSALCGQQMGFETRVITDGMGGWLMHQGEVNAFITAADRVCMDGTVCNKIGTYQYALAAKANNVPYYALRQSGPDRESASGSEVTIEYRDGEELVNWQNRRIAPAGVSGHYPAFDLTPPELVSAIVTDRGVFAPDAMDSYLAAPPFVENAIL
ncbi:MAG: s-methyl-5-thioribose-1-phosphate isomerase [Pseudomonadota bacterium]